MIYLAPGASIDLGTNQLVVNLKGLTDPSSQYYGVAFYQDRSNFTDAVWGKNGAVVTLDGALYFPVARILVKNNGLTTTACTVIVAFGIDMDNNGAFDFSNACSSFGGGPIFTQGLAE